MRKLLKVVWEVGTNGDLNEGPGIMNRSFKGVSASLQLGHEMTLPR